MENLELDYSEVQVNIEIIYMYYWFLYKNIPLSGISCLSSNLCIHH